MVAPEAFEYAISRLAAASNLPNVVAEAGIEAMLDEDETLTQKAVDKVMDALRKKLKVDIDKVGVEVSRLGQACDHFRDLATAYDAQLAAREAELTSTGGEVTGELADGEQPVAGRMYSNINRSWYGARAYETYGITPAACREWCMSHPAQCVVFRYMWIRAQNRGLCEVGDTIKFGVVRPRDAGWAKDVDILSGYGPKAVGLGLAKAVP